MDLTLIIPTGILLGCFLGLSWFAGSDAPYVPTKESIVRKILKAAGVKKGKKFYELGSGDGRVVLQAALLGAAASGIEQSLIRVIYSRFKAWRLASRLRGMRIKFMYGDVFKRSYRDADIVYIYLLPTGVEKLETKLKKELKKGSVIITQTFHFKNWKPFRKISFKPLEKPTRWDIKGEGSFQLYKN